MVSAELERYLKLWSLQIDGDGFETPTSWIQPVRRLDAPAMLKLLKPSSDEGNGAELLSYYHGQGAVLLFEADAQAHLMERAIGKRSLADMATGGQDMAAAEILADTLAKLHQGRKRQAPKSLTPLARQFSSLVDRKQTSALLSRCAEVARTLLGTQGDQIPLHGDMHHFNVLDGDHRGWLAIDPKALLGEATYDVANLLRNPLPHASLVHSQERMSRLAQFYARRLDLDVQRVLNFAFAHAGLSASWDIEDGEDPDYSLKCADVLLSLVDV